jgi:DNA-binding LacI/PurR family transcriptional regulator
LDKIDRNNNQALVKQLQNILIEQIRSGQLSPGQKIPSERELSRIYSVSRTTSRNAMLDLENKGYVTREVGSGTFVRSSAGGSQGKAESTGTIGFILCRHHFPVRSFREDYFYFGVMEGIQSELKQKGGHLLYSNYEARDDSASAIAELADKVDGILLAEAHAGSLIHGILEARIPCVLINPSVEHLKYNLDTVAIDNIAGAYKAVRYLVELGHTRIGCIRGPLDSIPARDRFEGYRRTLVDAGLMANDGYAETTESWTTEDGSAAIRRLIGRSPEISAVFCANDTLAIGAINGLAQVRLIPEEISVIGFDDIIIASHSTPPLTTMRSPIFELGQSACRQLLNRINNSLLPATTLLFSPELRIRSSTRSAS